jgi:hypothetical protein
VAWSAIRKQGRLTRSSREAGGWGGGRRPGLRLRRARMALGRAPRGGWPGAVAATASDSSPDHLFSAHLLRAYFLRWAPGMRTRNWKRCLGSYSSMMLFTTEPVRFGFRAKTRMGAGNSGWLLFPPQFCRTLSSRLQGAGL